MRRIFQLLTYSICFLIALGNGFKPDLPQQLSRVPSLLSHYRHHIEEEHEQISFYDFLVMHYAETSSHKAQEDHQDLPLYGHGFNQAQPVITQTVAVFITPIEIESVRTHTHIPNHYDFLNSAAIFQPPRFS